MQHVDTIIEAGWVLPVVPKHRVWSEHSVVIRAGRIIDVAPRDVARTRYVPRERVTLPSSLVMPGLVNLHSHAAMNLLRGLGADLPLMAWLTEQIWPAEGRLMSEEFVREGARLAGLEMLSAGVTTTSDQYFFPIAAAEGLRSAGLRCAVSAFVIGFPSAYAADNAAYRARMNETIRHFEGDAFVRVTVAPHAPYTVDNDTLAHCASLSERFNLPVHVHVHETAGEVADGLQAYGVRPLERLDRLGLVNERLIAVHAVHLNEREIARLSEAGASVCHCPSSNLKLASGFAPVAKLLRAGVNLGIGTDGAASNDKLDVLSETRLAALLAKAVAGDTTQGTVADLIEAATLGGAKALHWDHEIGSVEVGKAADLIAVDLSHVETLPVLDAPAQLLYAAGREHVTHTWVAGRLMMTKSIAVDYAGSAQADEPARLAERWRARQGAA